jgi:uncharacterized Zn finger protein (UPF0148 family)
MRRLASVLLTGLMIMVLAGCATTGGKMDNQGMKDGNVKCPACGFEFNTPSDA